mmetsp:Transcript_1728/g.3552  ORF Transcript_1728/g.3552 Transcript_1728/m.3552 type:complete len:113 (+) Transcript_1728:1693-2031(+)
MIEGRPSTKGRHHACDLPACQWVCMYTCEMGYRSHRSPSFLIPTFIFPHSCFPSLSSFRPNFPSPPPLFKKEDPSFVRSRKAVDLMKTVVLQLNKRKKEHEQRKKWSRFSPI